MPPKRTQPPPVSLGEFKKWKRETEMREMREMIGEGMSITIDQPWPPLEEGDRKMIYRAFCSTLKENDVYFGGILREGKQQCDLMSNILHNLPMMRKCYIYDVMYDSREDYILALLDSYYELQSGKRRVFLSLPLDERVQRTFGPGRPEVQSLTNITRMVLKEPEDSMENLFLVLVKYAMLVQGCWVLKTSSLNLEDIVERFFRDSVLYLFHESEFIHAECLLMSKDYEPKFKSILKNFSDKVEGSIPGWTFRGREDVFKFYTENHSEMEKEQRELWIQIREIVFTSSYLTIGEKLDGQTITLKDKAAICLTLPRMFQRNPVRSIGALLCDLAELAEPGILSEHDGPEVLTFKALVTTNVEMLLVLVQQYAHYVHNSFVKKAAETVCEKRLRKVVADIYMMRNEGDGIRKCDVVAVLKRCYDAEFTQPDIFDKLFTKSMTEIADPKADPKAGDGVIWFLKSGQ